MTPSQTTETTPVLIITGFLGSGKTTFLNWLLTQPGTGRIAVVVNEFGEIGLDHLLIATPVENIMLIEGGCLCCEVRGDLVQTLRDLWERRERGEIQGFDQVAIETTGLSNPVPLIQTVLCDETVRDHFSMNKVVTLVDAVNSPNQMKSYADAVRQVAVADLLLVSKRDLLGPEGSAVDDVLTSANPGAQRADVREGAPVGLTVAEILATDEHRSRQDFLDWLYAGERQARTTARAAGMELKVLNSKAHSSLETVSKSLGIETFSVQRPGEISSTSMVIWLNMLASLKGENLLRMKAILNIEGQPVAIHAAQTIVHQPVVLEEWPDDNRNSRFVVISQGSIRREFEHSLAQLDLLQPAPSPTGAIDPLAYARFINLAQAFGGANPTVSPTSMETL
jgi:G3E family GTPase